jgi:hypothetical protein
MIWRLPHPFEPVKAAYEGARSSGARRVVTVGVLATSVVAVTTACATSEVVPAASTTTTIAAPVDQASPGDTLDELAIFLRDRSFELSTRIGEGGAREALDQIEDVWADLGPPLQQSAPSAYRALDKQVSLLRVAVERKRPADADKAARNIDAIVTSLLAGQSASSP